MKEGDTLKDYNKALSRLAPYSVSVLWAGAVAAVAAATTVTVPFALLADGSSTTTRLGIHLLASLGLTLLRKAGFRASLTCVPFLLLQKRQEKRFFILVVTHLRSVTKQA